jgi:2-polyprenyl-3-methyl-5-hydroxy-6-metoxy-1,4-benzoquinol methylase
MRSDSELRPETIERLATAVYPSMAMMAGIQLDVFTPLKDGPLNAAQIAAALSLDPPRVAPLLYALVAIGLLTVDSDRFANTREADHFLVRGRPAYIGVRHHAYQRRWQAMLQVPESIRTGMPQGRWAYASMSSDERDVYYLGLHTETLAAGRDLAARQDFSSFRRLVDVGGGSGGLAIGLAQAWPHLSVTVVDLPATIPVARRHADEAGVSDRVRVIAADVVSEPLSGSYDVALLRGLLPVLAPDQARRAVAHVSQAIEPGGAIYVVGWILDDTRVAPPELAAYNLVFLSAFDRAQMYTEKEIRSWLADAGFQDVTRDRSGGIWGSDFMKARKSTTG